MEDLVTKIVDSDKMVYLLQGSEATKATLMKAIEEYSGGTASISDEFLDPLSYKDTEEDYNEIEDIFLDLITVRILASEYLVIHVPNTRKMSASRIKELVHGDFFPAVSLYD